MHLFSQVCTALGKIEQEAVAACPSMNSQPEPCVILRAFTARAVILKVSRQSGLSACHDRSCAVARVQMIDVSLML